LKLKKIKAKINRWMNENFAFKNGLELQYKDIQPKIMIEEYIGYGIERMENFKFHCFNGIPKFLWIDNNGQNIQKQNLYELKMNRKINELQLKFLGENNLKLIDKMIELSSAGETGERVPLYSHNLEGDQSYLYMTQSDFDSYWENQKNKGHILKSYIKDDNLLIRFMDNGQVIAQAIH